MAAKSLPLVSIITIVRNGEKEIERTMESVFRQSYPNIEYIVVDGASTDGTVDLIRKHERQIDYWRSEPDSGIYEAMNKGIGLAKGSLVGMINATDAYEDDVIHEIAAQHLAAPSAILYGPAMFIEESGKSYIWGCKIERLTERLMVPHAAVFVPKTVYAKRKYDQSFRISGDFDFLLSCYLHNEQFILLPRIIAKVKRGGVSDSEAELVGQELRRISRKSGLNLFPEDETHQSGAAKSLRRDSSLRRLLKLLWHGVLRFRDFAKRIT